MDKTVSVVLLNKKKRIPSSMERSSRLILAIDRAETPLETLFLVVSEDFSSLTPLKVNLIYNH